MADREKLIELLMETFPNASGCRAYYACCADELIANGVTVRKKGVWVHDPLSSYGVHVWFCSQCNSEVIHQTDFCPYCGADMRGGT